MQFGSLDRAHQSLHFLLVSVFAGCLGYSSDIFDFSLVGLERIRFRNAVSEGFRGRPSLEGSLAVASRLLKKRPQKGYNGYNHFELHIGLGFRVISSLKLEPLMFPNIPYRAPGPILQNPLSLVPFTLLWVMRSLYFQVTNPQKGALLLIRLLGCQVQKDRNHPWGPCNSPGRFRVDSST